MASTRTRELARTALDAALGAVAAYLLDPIQGAARRTRAAERAQAWFGGLWVPPGSRAEPGGPLHTDASLRSPAVVPLDEERRHTATGPTQLA